MEKEQELSPAPRMEGWGGAESRREWKGPVAARDSLALSPGGSGGLTSTPWAAAAAPPGEARARAAWRTSGAPGGAAISGAGFRAMAFRGQGQGQGGGRPTQAPRGGACCAESLSLWLGVCSDLFVWRERFLVRRLVPKLESN